jgi:hypothetical protein
MLRQKTRELADYDQRRSCCNIGLTDHGFSDQTRGSGHIELKNYDRTRQPASVMANATARILREFSAHWRFRGQRLKVLPVCLKNRIPTLTAVISIKGSTGACRLCPSTYPKGESMSEWTDNKQRVYELMDAGYTLSDVWLHTEEDGNGNTLRLSLTKPGCPNESASIRIGSVTGSIDDLSEFMRLWSKANQPT